MRLLYVEDNERLASNTAASLRKCSFVVDAVSTGEDAIHAAKSFAYDAIVLDLGLPDIDGLTVLERVRAARPGTPVVICTARDRLEDRVQGLNAGSDDYLVKPFEVAELVARLRAVLRRPGARSAWTSGQAMSPSTRSLANCWWAEIPPGCRGASSTCWNCSCGARAG